MKGFGRVKRAAFILDQVPSNGAVLHVGCTNSPTTLFTIANDILLHKHLLDRCPNAVGIDIDEPSIAILKEHLPGAEIIAGDANNLSDYVGGRLFDLIIAADVIEHLENPGLFLSACRDQLKDDGQVLVTTTNTFGVARFFKALLFHEAVHSEHTAYFSPKTLVRLGHLCGLETRRYGYYACSAFSEGPSVNKALTNAIETMYATIWPQFSEGVIVEYRRSD